MTRKKRWDTLTTPEGEVTIYRETMLDGTEVRIDSAAWDFIKKQRQQILTLETMVEASRHGKV